MTDICVTHQDIIYMATKAARRATLESENLILSFATQAEGDGISFSNKQQQEKKRPSSIFLSAMMQMPDDLSFTSRLSRACHLLVCSAPCNNRLWQYYRHQRVAVCSSMACAAPLCSCAPASQTTVGDQPKTPRGPIRSIERQTSRLLSVDQPRS